MFEVASEDVKESPNSFVEKTHKARSHLWYKLNYYCCLCYEGGI